MRLITPTIRWGLLLQKIYMITHKIKITYP